MVLFLVTNQYIFSRAEGHVNDGRDLMMISIRSDFSHPIPRNLLGFSPVHHFSEPSINPNRHNTPPSLRV